MPAPLDGRNNRIHGANHCMQLDDKVCLCFHVSKRKLVNYIRIEQPRRAAQLADCFGAGTGCGWCRDYLTRLFNAAQSGTSEFSDEPDSDQYAQQRTRYVLQGGGTPPPGATPVDQPLPGDERTAQD